MSSFFTHSARQSKRKRADVSPAPKAKKRQSHAISDARPLNSTVSKSKRDDSISSAKSDGEEILSGDDAAEEPSESSSDDGHETAAERRLRLAEQYLINIKGEVDEAGFNAEDVDKDLIAERLQEDTAESKGRVYRRIASDLDYPRASKTQFRANAGTTTSIAVCPPFVYTVTKDLVLAKWELPKPPPPSDPTKRDLKPARDPPPKTRRPKKLLVKRGDKNTSGDSSFDHHTAPILSVAASESGKYVATGGADKRLIIWSANDLTVLKIFTQHRDAVLSLAFRRGTNQLYSASRDRTIKVWSLDELAYVETLFGHQDEVVDIAALAREQCLSVGARDRSARIWKVVEETQLVFRGGGSGGSGKRRQQVPDEAEGTCAIQKNYNEGSIDRVAFVDEEIFVTGSDNGSLCLWTLHKKKPIFTVPLAHGLDPPLKPEDVFSEEPPNQKVPGEPQPRWITALTTIPYSDLIISGSWDGEVRVWRISEDKRKIEALGIVGSPTPQNLWKETTPNTGFPCKDEVLSIRGIINDLKVFARGDRGQDGLSIVVATGTEHRLGRWKKFKAKNGALVFEVPKLLSRVAENGGEHSV